MKASDYGETITYLKDCDKINVTESFLHIFGKHVTQSSFLSELHSLFQSHN